MLGSREIWYFKVIISLPGGQTIAVPAEIYLCEVLANGKRWLFRPKIVWIISEGPFASKVIYLKFIMLLASEPWLYANPKNLATWKVYIYLFFWVCFCTKVFTKFIKGHNEGKESKKRSITLSFHWQGDSFIGSSILRIALIITKLCLKVLYTLL